MTDKEQKTLQRWPTRGPLFQARQLSRIFYCSGVGYWSYPAFLRTKSGEVQWLHVGLGFEFEQWRTRLFRARVAAVTDANSPVLVRYEDFRRGTDPFPGEPWDKPVATYPHPAICEWTDERLAAETGKLFLAYPDAADAFAADAVLPDSFRRLYLQLSHPVFSRYLPVLAPAFSKALHELKETRR